MICPYCNIAFKTNAQPYLTCEDKNHKFHLQTCQCPECENNSFALYKTTKNSSNYDPPIIVYPVFNKSSRPPCPIEVPPEIAEDYNEACIVFADSVKASAALSRRCLQTMLRSNNPSIKQGDLFNEIQQVIELNKLPSHLSEGLNAVRVIGNFAAHPIKSKHSGEIMDVEPGEAEWNLEILEGLFDFYYVQPEILKKKKDALNKKLAEAGKPLLK